MHAQRAVSIAVPLVCATVACLLALSTTAVEARSNGILSYCDLTPIKDWPNGKFGKFVRNGMTITSGVMPWVQAPRPSTDYTLRTADGANVADDPKVYTPNVWNELHLRVHDLQMRWIGLVLYATDGIDPATKKERTVGEWTWPADAPFQVPEMCGGRAVTHTDANLKPLHTRFFWKPEVGTRNVTFRVLIKQGEQNKGNFWWPAAELKLDEGEAPWVPTLPPQPEPERIVVNGTVMNTTQPPAPTGPPEPFPGPPVWQIVVGDAGQACADACNLKTPLTPYCDPDGIAAINTAEKLKETVRGRAACRLPLLSGCPYAGGAQITDDGFCTFKTDDIGVCPRALQAAANASSLPPQPDLCFTAAAAGSKPICSCTNAADKQPPNPFARGGPRSGEAQTGAASRAGVSFAAMGMMAAAVAALAGRRASLLAVVLLALLLVAQPAVGHNYIKTHHRANEAAVNVPCQARIGNQPHVQIISGQEFTVEWSVGHGDFSEGPFYFAVVKEEDLMELKAQNITAIMMDYVKLSPTNASWIPPLWNKQHIRNMNEPKVDTYWQEAQLPKEDPAWIDREPVYRATAHPSQYKNNATVVQTRFKPEFLAKDKRASYPSAKYPWLESVSIFYNPLKEHEIYNNQADIARFTVPARKGPGNYVLYFYWHGYKDCVDINVMPGTTPVKNRYGVLPAPGSIPNVIKQDHCEFTYIGSAATPCRKMGPNLDASQCIRECVAQGMTRCTGVQVVRATNPPGTLPYTPNLPFITWQSPNQTLQQMGVFQPCSELSVHGRTVSGCVKPPPSNCNPATLQLLPEDYVCFGLLPRRNQDNQVEEDYRVVDEPEDPIFSSTCYHMDPLRNFIDVPQLVFEHADWDAGDQCLKCDFHQQLRELNATASPNWYAGLTDQCANCDLVASDLPLATVVAQLAGAPQPEAGRGGSAGWDTGSSSKGPFGLEQGAFVAVAVTIVVIGLALIGASVFLTVRWCKSRNQSALALSNIARASDTHSTELTTNPAIAARF